jgi:hypothetical protein
MLTVGPQSNAVALEATPFSLDLSNDGRLLACASQTDGNLAPVVRVLRTDDGSVVGSHSQVGVQRARGVAFVNDGSELVFVCQWESDSTVLTRMAVGGTDAQELKRYPSGTHIHGIARDLRGRFFAVLGNLAEIWDAEAGQIVHVFPSADRDRQVHAAFSRDGERIYIYGAVEKTVVCYDVASWEERGRWEAPTRFGAQVLVTPDERFLVIAGTSHKGLFIYDLVGGCRVRHDVDDVRTFDETALWQPLVVAHDGSLLASIRQSVAAFQLPMVEDVTVRKSVVEWGTDINAATWAWEAPLIAFATRQDARLLWFPLEPRATPPVVVDHLTFNDDTDFETLVAEILRGGGGSLRGDSFPLDWINRAYDEVKSSPYACRIAHAVAGCLTAAEPEVRAQALVFFQTHPSAGCGSRITTLAAGDRELFAGIADPMHPGTDLEQQLLMALAARIGAYDSDALHLACAEALRPGKAAPLIAALVAAAPDWVVANAEKIVRATPEAGATLLIHLQGGDHDLLSLARRVAPLCHDDRRFELDVSRFIDSPDFRQVILEAFTRMPEPEPAPVEPPVAEFDELGLRADVRQEVEEHALRLIHAGFRTRADIAGAVSRMVGPPDERVSMEQAQAIVDRRWAERVAEQGGWPAVTDADRLLAVFDSLDAAGIVARADFTCCSNCGVTEIGAEAAEGARGYVFFHEQDTAGVVQSGSMCLSYGSLRGSTDDALSVGREVVAALTAGGVPVVWDGSVDSRICVQPLDWKMRLVG